MDKGEEEILSRYTKKLGENIDLEIEGYNPEGFSREYNIFREEALSIEMSSYERLCKSFGKFLNIKPSEKDYFKLKKSIDIIHLDISPNQASGFGTFIGLLLIFFGIILGLIVFFVKGTFDLNLLLIPLVFMLMGVLV